MKIIYLQNTLIYFTSKGLNIQPIIEEGVAYSLDDVNYF